MKSIEAVSIWIDGQGKEANTLNLYVVNDDLKSSCTFYYALLQKVLVPEPEAPVGEVLGDAPSPEPRYTYNTLAQGNLFMSGEEYANWNGEADINAAAYEWATTKLSLTLTLE